MRTRTFIGMILLVLALMVASTPSLLNLVSGGVQAGAHKMGVPGVPAAQPASVKIASDKPAGGTFDDRLELKGYVADKDDMRDQFSTAERIAVQGSRLSDGSSRALLPGQLKDATASTPPLPTGAGVLLDTDGCPMFRTGANSADALASPEAKQLYADKVASSDDPATCQSTFASRTIVADPAKATATPIGALARHYSPQRLAEMDLSDLAVETAYLTMLQSMVGSQGVDAALGALSAAAIPAKTAAQKTTAPKTTAAKTTAAKAAKAG